MEKLFSLTVIALFTITITKSQSLAINTDGSTANASAMLDVKNTNKGMLIPRVALTGSNDLLTIPAAATSLLIYNTSSIAGANAVSPGYYYWSGALWLRLQTNLPWLLTGNTGNVDATNFIGNTDNVPLNFRVSNQKAGRIDSTLLNSFWGYQAGNANTTGSSNTAIGFQSFYLNTAGTLNTAIGMGALQNNNIGSANTATGVEALKNNTGSYNTALGWKSLYWNTTGANNVAIGDNALANNGSGGGNVAVGENSMLGNLSGTFNTCVGQSATVTVNGLTNATSIGAGAQVNASNKVRLGNAIGTAVEGQVAYSFPSDARFKYNIKNDVPGLDFIKKLTPVTYYFDNQKFDEYCKTGIIKDNIVYPAGNTEEKQLQTGFLAQDIEKITKELGYRFDGLHAPENNRDYYTIAYSQFIMPLVRSVQEQQQMIATQDKKINSQQEQIIKMNQQIEDLARSVKALQEK